MQERKLTKPEAKAKERIVKDLKGAKADFKKRYGDDAEAVMYATATKRAKKIAEGVDPVLLEKIAAGLLLILGPVGIKLGFDQLIKLSDKYVAPAIDKFYGKVGAGTRFLSKNLKALKNAASKGKEALEIKLQDLLMIDNLDEGSCGYNEDAKTGKKLKTPGGLDEIINELIGDLVYEELCKRGKAYIAARKRAGEKSSAYLSGRAVKVCKGQIKGAGGKRKKSYKNESLYNRLKPQILNQLEELFNDPHFAIVAEYNVEEANIDESLRDWFKKEKWVRIDTQGNIAGKCGTMPKGKATQRCLPRAKAQSLTKAQRRATARKKVRGSKKGKQFVRNTKKAKVSFKKK